MTIAKAVAISKKDVANMKYVETQNVTRVFVRPVNGVFLILLFTKARK